METYGVASCGGGWRKDAGSLDVKCAEAAGAEDVKLPWGFQHK